MDARMHIENKTTIYIFKAYVLTPKIITTPSNLATNWLNFTGILNKNPPILDHILPNNAHVNVRYLTHMDDPASNESDNRETI